MRCDKKPKKSMPFEAGASGCKIFDCAGRFGPRVQLMNPPDIAPLVAGHTLGYINDDFVVAEWRGPGGPPGPPRLIAPVHLHRSDDEAWYVLEGSLHVQVGDQVVETRAGAGVLVPKGTP